MDQFVCHSIKMGKTAMWPGPH